MSRFSAVLRRAALAAALLFSGGELGHAQGTYPGTQEPWFLTGGITLFVDGSAGSDSNSGMAAGAGNAWATFAPAFKFLCNRTNGNGFSATIQVANAASIAGAGGIGGSFQFTCTPVGYTSIILNLGGGTLTPASGFDAVQVAMGMQGPGIGFPALHVVNGTLVCSGGGTALRVIAGYAVVSNVGGAITFGNCPGGGSHIFADGGSARVFVSGGYTISGNALWHQGAQAGGLIDFFSAATITCTGTPAFTAFAFANINAQVAGINQTFSGCGSVTGKRYLAQNNGSIFTQGGGANFYPGNAAGAVTQGGRYDSPGTPTVTSCGTTPGAPSGTDQSGLVQEGTTATGCTINFTTGNAPFACVVASNNATISAGITYSVTATQLVISHPSVSSAFILWVCPSQ